MIKRLDVENDSHDIWYEQITNKNADYVLNVDTDEATNYEPGVFVNHKIRDSDKRVLGIRECGAEASDGCDRAQQN